ncbi:probable serine hydrolase [Athalia rosae]|uniref:probable serine hydrolase n=1 Tax=Athalia rosae TaxID=37344 RepID=UPI0020333F8F|nr:probable serine hydrolase [Athalia rosae]
MLSCTRRLGKIAPFSRAVQSLYRNQSTLKLDVDEFDIPMPWGKIAAKWWGPKDRQPILALHGWQDNVATFDTMIPLLPPNTSVLAIDLPGHGYSTWLPPGQPYSLLGSVLLIRRIVKWYKWQQVKLLGHSMGGMMVFLYASYFPKDIQFGISIDMISPPITEASKNCENIAWQINEILRLETRKSQPPKYSYKELMQKWIIGTDHSLDEPACELLMVRSAKEIQEGLFIFTKDPRLIKYSSLDTGYSLPYTLTLAERIKCPYRIIKAIDSPWYQDKQLSIQTVKEMEKSSVDFKFHLIPGKHHLHLTHPETAVEIINPFLEKYNV